MSILSPHFGDLDLVMADQQEETVVWLENDGGSPATFTLHPGTVTETPQFVFPADIDLDGRVDLLAAGFGEFIWHENVIGVRLEVTGLEVRQFRCRNRTTGQTILLQSSESMVDCEVEGLVVEPGDLVEVFVRGRAR